MAVPTSWASVSGMILRGPVVPELAMISAAGPGLTVEAGQGRKRTSRSPPGPLSHTWAPAAARSSKSASAAPSVTTADRPRLRISPASSSAGALGLRGATVTPAARAARWAVAAASGSAMTMPTRASGAPPNRLRWAVQSAAATAIWPHVTWRPERPSTKAVRSGVVVRRSASSARTEGLRLPPEWIRAGRDLMELMVGNPPGNLL